MLEVKLKRDYREDRTRGSLWTAEDAFIGDTLERPWKNNQVGISCIPEGEYEVHRDITGRFTWFSVKNVEGRTHIEFHEGTEPWHSQGCILMSTIALQNLMIHTQGQPFKLIIEEG